MSSNRSKGLESLIRELRADFVKSVYYAIFQDQKSSGTNGGTFTSGAWRTRGLNTEIFNQIGATLSSDQFTLLAGAYLIRASAEAFSVDRHAIRIRNITDGTTELSGTSEYARSVEEVANRSFANGELIIASSKIFEIQHQCETTRVTNGFGVAAGGSFAVDVEIYTTVEIIKVG